MKRSPSKEKIFPSNDIRERQQADNYAPPGSGRAGRFLRALLRLGAYVPSQRVDLGVANSANLMTRLRIIIRYI